MRNYREFLARSGSLDCSLWLSLSKVGHFRTSHVSWVLCKLSDVEEGRSEVEDDHGSPCGETGYQGHELFGLGRCKHSWMQGSPRKHFCNPMLWSQMLKVWDAKAGWIQEDEPAKGTVQRGKRQGRVSATIHDKKVGADRGSLRSRSGYGTPKDLRARLRKENMCFRCKKKSHWKAECPEKQHNKDGTAPAVFSGLTYLHTVNEESVWSAATWSGQYDETRHGQRDPRESLRDT